MPHATLMPEAEVAAALKTLSGWQRLPNRNAIQKTYQFKSFVEAFGFMAKVALTAEKLDHHPEWFNVYGKVEVTLATHSAGGITDLDITLARAMDRLAG